MSALDKLSSIADKFEAKLEKTAAKKSKKGKDKGSFVFGPNHPKVKDGKGHFPIDTENRARAALRYAGHKDKHPWFSGSVEELRAAIRRAVKRKYPKIDVSEKKSKKSAFVNEMINKYGQIPNGSMDAGEFTIEPYTPANEEGTLNLDPVEIKGRVPAKPDANVRSMQAWLNTQNPYFALKEDGIYGNATKGALAEWAKNNGVSDMNLAYQEAMARASAATNAGNIAKVQTPNLDQTKKSSFINKMIAKYGQGLPPDSLPTGKAEVGDSKGSGPAASPNPDNLNPKQQHADLKSMLFQADPALANVVAAIAYGAAGTVNVTFKPGQANQANYNAVLAALSKAGVAAKVHVAG